MYDKALRLKRTSLGDHHPATLATVNATANVLREQGKLDAAEPLYQEALRWRRESLGSRHPHTLGTMGDLANLLADQGALPPAFAAQAFRPGLFVLRRQGGVRLTVFRAFVQGS